jgi:restriction endonuclease S subunit
MLNITDINNDIDLSDEKIIKGISMDCNIIFDIIDSLMIGGECCIVLPYNNVFYNKTDNDYISLRKYILKTCDLKEVTYLPIGMFNKNVKMFFLYFIKTTEKNNKYQTENIRFYDYNFFDNSKEFLTEANINDIIINNCSFNYTDYLKETILAPDCYIIKTLSEIAIINSGDFDNGANSNDKFKIYGCKDENKTTNKYNREGFNIIVTKYKVFLTEEKLFLNNYAVSVKPKTNIILHKYLAYYLFYKYKNINLKTLKNLKISIPSIEVQEEIINFIDSNDKTIVDLNNQIDDLKLKSSILFYNIN